MTCTPSSALWSVTYLVSQLSDSTIFRKQTNDNNLLTESTGVSEPRLKSDIPVIKERLRLISSLLDGVFIRNKLKIRRIKRKGGHFRRSLTGRKKGWAWKRASWLLHDV